MRLRRRGLASINSEIRDGIMPAADTIARVAKDPDALPHTPSNYRVTALIIACALFMEQMDSTVLATALTTMARDYGVPATSMSSALTSYLLALAIFIPASGRLADRFGRTDFLSLLTAQAALTTAQANLAASDALLVDRQVDVFKALGGGWQT